MNENTQFTNVLRIALTAITVSLAFGCGSAAEDSGEAATPNIETQEVRDAQASFFESDILGANQKYELALQDDPTNSEARAGAALTSLLLFPYDPSVSELLTCCLGADRGLSADRNVIYGEDGLLYLLSLGVPFDDDGGNPDIKTLLAEDLPWSRQRLDSADAFFGGLDRDVNEIFDKLQGVALALKPIEEKMKAVGEDEEFESFFVPGEAFHDPDLSLVLGKTEIALGRAVLGGTRTVIQFLGAYEYSWTLEEAFGPRWDALTPADNDFVDGWTYEDYVTNFLSQRLFRQVRNPDRLGNARSAALTTIEAIRDSIRLGLDGQAFELGWEEANDQVGREVDELLVAVAESLSGSTEVPYTTPSVSMDLTSFVEAPGRTLSTETALLERIVNEDDFEEFTSWDFTEAAVDELFVRGVFTPEEAPEIQFSGDQQAFTDSLFGGLEGQVDDAYFSGR